MFQNPQIWTLTFSRWVESAVGAYLLGGAEEGDYSVYYWRERSDEVDFVVAHQGEIILSSHGSPHLHVYLVIQRGRWRESAGGFFCFSSIERKSARRSLSAGAKHLYKRKASTSRSTSCHLGYSSHLQASAGAHEAAPPPATQALLHPQHPQNMARHPRYGRSHLRGVYAQQAGRVQRNAPADALAARPQRVSPCRGVGGDGYRYALRALQSPRQGLQHRLPRRNAYQRQ